MLKILLRKIAAVSLFGRMFRGVFFVALLCVFFVWGWLNSRFYQTLDREADQRLRRIAEILLIELKDTDSEDRTLMQIEAMQAFWQLEKNGGLLQNFYWLDVSAGNAEFIASYSAQSESKSRMLPPSAEEAEDLVFEHINELDRGEMVFPDPYAFDADRRFKILLCPIIDANGILQSIIGIESDMEYLNLVVQFRKFLAEGIFAAIILSLLVAYLLARNLTGKIEALNFCVKQIEAGKHPAPQSLDLIELDQLYQSFVSLAKELERQKLHVQQVFNRKLDELSFTGGAIAHEIRNPLSAIEMHFGLLRRELQKSQATAADSPAIVEINQQLQHLRQLLDNFLGYTRKVQAKPVAIRLHEFTSYLLSSKKAMVSEFVSEIDMAEDLVVYFDQTMLQQILENLVNNSLRACREKVAEIIIYARVESQMLTLCVRDNGPGVPADIRQQLFTPFATSDSQGNGFGLALVRKLVEAHGGEIIYTDGKIGGAVFTLEVPQHENSCS